MVAHRSAKKKTKYRLAQGGSLRASLGAERALARQVGYRLRKGGREGSRYARSRSNGRYAPCSAVPAPPIACYISYCLVPCLPHWCLVRVVSFTVASSISFQQALFRPVY